MEEEFSTDPFASAAVRSEGNNSAYTRAHPCSKLFFTWLTPVFEKGSDLKHADLPSLDKDDAAVNLARRLERAWDAEITMAGWNADQKAEGGPKPSLVNAMIDAYLWDYFPKGIILVLKSGFAVSQALTVGWFLEALENPNSEFAIADGWVLAALIVILGAGMAACHHWGFFHGWRWGMRWRAAVTALVHRKQLRLTLSAAHSGAGVGKVTTLIGTDTERLQKSSQFVYFLYVGPIELGLTFWALYYVAGVASVAGMVLILLMVPLQMWFSRMFAHLRRTAAEFTDERVKLSGQVVGGIMVVKSAAWEEPMLRAVSRVREKELEAIRTTNTIRAVNEGVFTAAPVVISSVIFLTRVGIGEPLSPRVVFSTLGLIYAVSLMATKFMPFMIESLAETLASLKRIEEFLLLPEIDVHARAGRIDQRESSLEPVPTRDQSAEDDEDVTTVDDVSDVMEATPEEFKRPRLEVIALHAKWEGSDEGAFGLEDVTLKVFPGQVHCVVGAVGAGKTSLLEAVLGEMEVKQGLAMVRHVPEIEVHGILTREPAVILTGHGGPPLYTRVAYAPQTAWVIAGTLRENVVLGRPWDEKRYKAVLHACCLEPDVALLPYGHETILGDRGINLSGGQRARLGLARCLYGDAAVYLLDDPLSAVDAKVGRRIFERCIQELLLNRQKESRPLPTPTSPSDHNSVSFISRDSPRREALRLPAVVLVTHQTAWIPFCDAVSVMREGKVVSQGVPTEVDLSEVELDAEKSSEEDEENELPEQTAVPAAGAADPTDIFPATFDRRRSSSTRTTSDAEALRLAAHVDADDAAAPEVKVQVSQQNAAQSAKDNGIVEEEKMAIGSVSAATFLDYLGAAGGPLMCSGILALYLCGTSAFYYTQAWLAAWSRQDAKTQQSANNIGAFVGLVCLTLVLSLTRSILFFRAGIVASQRLHDATFARVLTAPLSFFWANPEGRILSRLSKDLGFVDDMLPWAAQDTANLSLVLLGACIVTAVSNPWLVLAVVPILITLFLIRQYYLRTALVVRRLEAVSRSPIFHTMGETHTGLAAARSMELGPALEKLMTSVLDWNNRAFFAFLATSRWFGMRLDFAGLTLLAAACFASLALRDTIDPGLLGVSLSSLSALLGTSQWMMRQSAEVQVYAVSVERLLEYAHLKPEKVDVPLPSVRVGSAPEVADNPALQDSSTPTSKTTNWRATRTTLPSVRPSSSTPTASSTVLPSDWPRSGALELRDLRLRYRPSDPLVLKGISISIPTGSRVGVVGRTGAGKSSLFLSLLRLVEYERGEPLAAGAPSVRESFSVDADSKQSQSFAATDSKQSSAPQDAGSVVSTTSSSSAGHLPGVYLDNVRTCNVPLTKLRRHIALIGQNPILFAGTVRANLDPFERATTEELYNALEAVQLREWVDNLPHRLNSVVTGGGANLSVGQRQLLALARALLRKATVLLLDEPSANVDPRTDAALQTAIRRHFRNATVITVAHRLATVADSDIVMVLDKGYLVESGRPKDLLRNPRGHFASLVAQAHVTELVTKLANEA